MNKLHTMIQQVVSTLDMQNKATHKKRSKNRGIKRSKARQRAKTKK